MPEAAAVAAADAPASPEANKPQGFIGFYQISKQTNPRFKTAKTWGFYSSKLPGVDLASHSKSNK
jgi:hypothetical protein